MSTTNQFCVIVALFVVLLLLYCVQRLHPEIRMFEEHPTIQRMKNHSSPKYSADREKVVADEVESALESTQTTLFNKIQQEESFQVQQSKHFERGSDVNSSKVRGENKTKYDHEIGMTPKSTQLERLQHFRKQCKLYKFDVGFLNSSDELEVLHAEKYKLACRQVAKIGSTFLIQVFTILTQGTDAATIFNKARSDIHNVREHNHRIMMPFKSLNAYTLMVMARNPYSRLYSAYVDKVFILNTLDLCKDLVVTLFGIQNLTKMCKFDITFEQFLQYYFEKGGIKMQSHYAPLLSNDLVRKLCNLSNIMIVKQETFSDDIDQALKSGHVEDREYDILYDEMHSRQSSTTISSIVKTVYKKFSSHIKSNSCLSWKEIAKKLWISFQIQGYIYRTSNFPEKEFKREKNYSSSKYLIQVVMAEVKNNPMKHEEKVRQRNDAVLKAFKDVDNRYIHKIQERYAMDFDMFQYNTDLKVPFT